MVLRTAVSRSIVIMVLIIPAGGVRLMIRRAMILRCRLRSIR